ncbi:MAG: tyrosine-type recombinase/integrase [Methylobacter sp.]
MPLTDATIRNAKANPDKIYKITDERGMYLAVNPNGGKYFRLKYRYGGKEKTLALGVYPVTSLKEARDKRDTAKKQLASGIDPSVTRKIEKAACTENTFKAVAEDFLITKKQGGWSDMHLKLVTERFERDVYPYIGDRPLAVLSAVEVLTALRRIVARGTLETASKTRQYIGQAIRYGIATGRADRDITQDLRGALPSPAKGHYCAITDPKPLARLLRDIDEYGGSTAVKTALQIQPLIFARPSNLAAAEWEEFDLDSGEWRIAADKMKMNDAHIVPLSTQAIELLTKIQSITGNNRYVFTSHQGKTGDKHIHKESIGTAIRRLGYLGQHTAHGFRTTASTLLHEHGFNSDMIERQLAHSEPNKVKAAYNRAQHLPERRLMMQQWADYLDSLKSEGKVVPFRRIG